MFLPRLYFSPNESATPVEANELSKEEAIDFLAGEENEEEIVDIKPAKKPSETPPIESKESDTEDTETSEKTEIDELTELEEELKGPDEDKLELMAPVRRKEILAAYPDLFKKFPYLERAYYREQKFTELLPTIEDAQEAVTKADTLDKFEADISKGNLENALRAVKGSGEVAFNSLVDNYLPNLAKIDRNAYHHVIGNIIRTTTVQMLQEARASNNEELHEAARTLNNFVFGSNKIQPPTNLSQPITENEESNQFQKQQQDYNRQRYETSRDELTSKISNVLKSTIEANIDPKGSMTDYVRKNASRETQETLISLLDSDKRLSVIIDKLWEGHIRDNFSKASLDKIKSAYLSRAKTLLPTVLQKARTEALKGSSRRMNNDSEEVEEKKGHLPVGRTASSSNSSKSAAQKAKEIPEGMSTKDYLMQD